MSSKYIPYVMIPRSHVTNITLSYISIKGSQWIVAIQVWYKPLRSLATKALYEPQSLPLDRSFVLNSNKVSSGILSNKITITPTTWLNFLYLPNQPIISLDLGTPPRPYVTLSQSFTTVLQYYSYSTIATLLRNLSIMLKEGQICILLYWN
jgi:hypothetical protein